jgi:crotonobetainyl-CoA:carnitine CoA-transferase CaiB-like acyl-CoA transferase
MRGLLAGVTVLEVSSAVAVRYCGRLFAQLGARVIRAATDPAGDDAIGYAGVAGEAYGRWLDAGKLNRGDRPVDLVLGGPGEADVAAAEAAAAGLPGDPSVVSITWFHPEGPYSGWTGTDEIIHALAGLAYAFGPAEGPPTLAQGHGPQVAAGIVAFNAALGALMARPRPRRVAVNVFEAFMCLTETGAIAALMEGGLAHRLGVNRFVPTCPCASFRSADGWVGVTALTPGQWQALCRMLGRPQLAGDPRFATSLQRLLLADEVEGLIAPAFLARTTDEWVRLGEAARVPITAMPDLAQLPGVPHWRERGAFGPFDESGRPAPTLPFRMSFDGVGQAAPAGPTDAPLKGVRVVDFTMGWAGPLCARTLADLGADVIKVESRDHPDWWRGWEVESAADPPPGETKFSFISVNRNKRDVLLDLSRPEGMAQARRLVAQADVVVENFAAGVMEKLGLGADERRRLRPGLIAVSMPAFGNGGPLSGIRAYGSTVEQASGLPFANGLDAWPPCLQHVAYGDPIAGLFAAAAVLAALEGRDRAGGAEIDLAQVACLFQFGADAIIAQQLSPAPLERSGSRRPRAAPVCVVPCGGEDSWLAVAVSGDAAWPGLCSVIGRPEWAQAHATLAARSAAADEIETAIAAWAAARTPADAARDLQEAGVSAAPVQPTHTLCYDAQLSVSGFFAPMTRRHVGDHLVPAAPWSFDGRRPALYRPAPTLGEHTEEIVGQGFQAAGAD